MTVIDPIRTTCRLYMHNNMEWLRNLKNEVGSPCHGRRFRVWRWEQAVGHCEGTEWTNVAQDRVVWPSKIVEMVKWKKQKMADRSVIEFG